jgi:ABC-type branched-subunit amino acid transport system substrate-binding protein
VGGAASGKYNFEEAGHESMALSFKNDKGSQSFAASVGEAFSNLGGEIVAEVPLAINASSYRSEIGTLQDAAPDIVQMTAGTEVSTLFVKNYSELGAKETFNLVLGNDALTQDFISEVGTDVAEGFLGQAPAPGPAFDEFSESFQNVNGGEPGTFAGEAYDAVNQFALAFEAHGAIERQAIPDQLENISNPPGTQVTTFAEGKEELANGSDINYIGAANPQNFDDNGNVVGPFSILQATGGSWESLTTYEAEALAEVYETG